MENIHIIFGISGLIAFFCLLLVVLRYRRLKKEQEKRVIIERLRKYTKNRNYEKREYD